MKQKYLKLLASFTKKTAVFVLLTSLALVVTGVVLATTIPSSGPDGKNPMGLWGEVIKVIKKDLGSGKSEMQVGINGTPENTLEVKGGISAQQFCFHKPSSDPNSPTPHECISSWPTGNSGTTCGETVSYEGEDYPTEKIGDECWFAKNLNVGTMLSHATIDPNSDNSTIEKWCCENTLANCQSDGGAYSWKEAMKGSTTEGAQGICPDGWHIPTKDEVISRNYYQSETQEYSKGCSIRLDKLPMPNSTAILSSSGPAIDVTAAALAGLPVRCVKDGDSTEEEEGDPDQIVDMALNYRSLCLLYGDGKVKCKGMINGAMYDNFTEISNVEAKSIFINDYQGLDYLNKDDGFVRMYGNLNGMSIDNVSSVDSDRYACVLLKDNTVKCRGNSSNGYGELGAPANTGTFQWNVINNLTNVKSLNIGSQHSCALITDGTVKCWGGKIANGSESDSYTPITVSGLNDVIAIDSSNEYTCALIKDGTVKCWGGLSFGGSLYTDSSPYEIYEPGNVKLSNAVSVIVGWSTACALIKDGTVKCWGDNDYGQLGPTGVNTYNIAQKIGDIKDITLLAKGKSPNFCALDKAGKIYCWGYTGSLDELFPAMTNTYYPVEISRHSSTNSDHDHIDVIASANNTCLVRRKPSNDSTAYNFSCLGPNLLNQRIDDYKSFSVGSSHACALLNNGTVKCWGNNSVGQLGTGSAGGVSTNASIVPGLSNVISMDSNFSGNCVVLNGGTVKCWGDVDNASSYYYSPVDIGINNAVKVKVGNSFSCALLNDGTVKCWGYNVYSQLGNGNTTDQSTPVAVSGLNNVKDISLGYRHACALVNDGVVKCWGDNDYGQLGQGQFSAPKSSNIPVELGASSDVASIDSGNFHNCVVHDNGNVTCWGYNSAGQLGNGLNVTAHLPVSPSDAELITGGMASKLSLGENHSCAYLKNGVIKCWGINTDKQITNLYNNRPTLMSLTGTDKGDNLGDHKAIQNLNMNEYSINTVNKIFGKDSSYFLDLQGQSKLSSIQATGTICDVNGCIGGGTSSTSSSTSSSGSSSQWTNVTGGINYAGGNVGIGTSTPATKLDVKGIITTNGINDSSDIRLKKDITNLNDDFAKVQKLQGVNYFWKDTKDKDTDKQIGLIAQEVEKVYPELVETDKAGMKSINYSHLIAPIIEAFKTLVAKVEAIELSLKTMLTSLNNHSEEITQLEKENKALKAENTEIKARLDKIEQMMEVAN